MLNSFKSNPPLWIPNHLMMHVGISELQHDLQYDLR